MSEVNRTVDTELITNWIRENNPRGVVKLSSESEISDSTIQKVRLGYVPRKPDTRRRISEAMGISENDLFPLVDAGEEEAS